ncbi:MAG TPA: hypothetical protein VHL53_12535 [Acidimicrobiia bacterium]|nr:hypothetical protein [Acidimicrobiia bacterium]
MAELNGRPLTDYSSVVAWMGSVSTDPIRARIRQRELVVLGDFCRYQQQDPDTIISTAQADRDVKNGYMRSLKQWVAKYAPEGRERHEAENAVRSFFIANGMRVIAKPYSDVYRRNGSGIG